MKKIMDPNCQRNNNFMTTLVKIINSCIMENMNNKQVILSLVSTYNNLPNKVHHARLFILGESSDNL